ncbi:MAG: DUF2779 domain-containing protein [Elusimicrobia bacterium]|nr:DUF2779 domain-containing protein [Elusimicrobiota bacterium]
MPGRQDKERVGYLGDGIEDPGPRIAALLARQIGPNGSVVAYNAKFESSVLQGLTDGFPKQQKTFLGIKARLWDLYFPFKKRHYVHPKFYGSASIKTVLPALVPEMTYEDMEIAEGGEASRAYQALMTADLPANQTNTIKQNLIKYCGQDTLPTVKILKHLEGLTQ